MKKLIIPFIALLFSLNTNAQKPKKEKIKALKIAHITEHLNLSSKEAQAFWPIYNANEDARLKLREETRLKHVKNIDTLSEAEAKNYLDNLIKNELAKQELNKAYFNKMKTILSSKKMLKLLEADRSFRRKMINEFKERHRGDKPPRKRK